MADQVNPTGSLATGPPQILLAAATPQPIPEKSRPAKTADSKPSKPEGRPLPQSVKATDADMKAINDYLQQTNSNLEFKVDKGTGITYFKIVDATTGEVIRQVPSDEILTMARKLRALSSHKDASGVLMDKEG
jgi:flagellar protein FlaG